MKQPTTNGLVFSPWGKSAIEKEEKNEKRVCKREGKEKKSTPAGDREEMRQPLTKLSVIHC